MDGQKGCRKDGEGKRKSARWFGLRIRFLFGFSAKVTCHRVVCFVCLFCLSCLHWFQRDQKEKVIFTSSSTTTVNAVLGRPFLGLFSFSSLSWFHSFAFASAYFVFRSLLLLKSGLLVMPDLPWLRWTPTSRRSALSGHALVFSFFYTHTLILSVSLLIFFWT